MRLSIRVKLLLSFGFLLLMMAGLGITALVEMAAMNEKAVFIEKNTIPTMNMASDMRRVVNRYRGLQASLLVYTSNDNITKTLADLNTQEEEMTAQLDKYEPLIFSPEERTAYTKFVKLWDSFRQRTDAELLPSKTRGETLASETIFTNLKPVFDELVTASAELRTIVEGQGNDALGEVRNAYSTASGLVVGFTIVVVLIAGALGFMLSSAISRNIGKLATATGDVAGGNFERRVELNTRDELGFLADQFNQMVEQLKLGRAAQNEARTAEERRNEQERQVRALLQQAVNVYSVFISRVAAGDLTSRVAPQGDADMQRIGVDLNTMVESLHSITSQVIQANANIAASAAEIMAATTQQAASAAEQSAAITQTTTTIEEVKAIAMQTAQQAAQVAQDSQNALSIARQGTQSVEETVAGMAQIRTRVETIAQTILGLAEQTQAIGSIITTVSELADQSNLLALNAAIEAARAGEQGKSFAVVAQHVRELAERSKGATGQVREILSDIQRATNAAVLVTEEGTKGVESGAKLASQAGQMIHRIAGEVEGGSQANIQMAAAAQQQMAGMEQIGQAMGSIQQATTQALASTRQAERAAQDLHTLAQNLQKVVAAYRL